MTRDSKKVCEDCGLSDFVDVIRVWCYICEPVLRCESCHRKHVTHVGVELRARGKASPVYVRADS